MYGNRERSVLGEDVPEIGTEESDDSPSGFSREDLSPAELDHLREATDRVGRAVETLVPTFVETDTGLTDTPDGFAGVVTVSFPGTPPVGAPVAVDRAALDSSPALSQREVDNQVSELVAQAVAVARQGRFDPGSAPAN